MKSSVVSLLRARWAAFAHDLLWVPLVFLLAYWLRFNLGVIPDAHWAGMIWLLIIAIPVQASISWYFGLYRGIWRFASVPDLVRILKAVAAGTLIITITVFVLQRLEGVPRSVLLLYPILLTLGLAGPRLLYRWFKDHRFSIQQQEAQRALIIGAGEAGELLARDLLKHGDYLPVAFVDDDASKQGREIHGVRVLGALDDMQEMARRLAVDVVLLAIPSANARLVRQIVQACADEHIPCRTLPSMAELASGSIEVNSLREVRIEDLLGRAPVELDQAGLHAFLQGKCVLVTGAGGSIGSELCRQIMPFGPDRLIMLDHAEFNLYQIEREMGQAHSGHVSAVLGDVRDEFRLHWLFEHFQPQVVFHAAAYKHVPLVEENPAEGVKTNVLGTRLVADMAVQYGAEKFVLVSTDKVVNPANIMGASKRVAEIYCQNLDTQARTQFITTRFGNVLGSTGSVVPLFRDQIAHGGPVTVTHPEITRYFMTIPEACQLILQAGAMGEGGEIFVLDMGEPVRIVHLAEQMIRLSGLEPGQDIDVRFIGLRPGEKLHEELFHEQEHLVGTQHPKIMLAEAREMDWRAMGRMLDRLQAVCASRDITELRSTLKQLVPEFLDASAEQAAPSESSAPGITLH